MSLSNRRHVFDAFERYEQDVDERDMDDICAGGKEAKFELQIQQQFLKAYISKRRDWRSLLLYHQIGSGKTCTAITIAEQYRTLKKKDDVKVRVILPARLVTNFIDELISPCGMGAYITPGQYKLYTNPNTVDEVKTKIRKSFMDKINSVYDIMSYDKLRNLVKKTDLMLSTFISNFTKDALIIVDEVHNLLGSDYDKEAYEKIKDTGYFTESKGMNALLFRFLNEYAHSSCKMVYLTATPIFDSLKQLKQLVTCMRPDVELSPYVKISECVEHLRGHVSFFPGTSPYAYPSVEYLYHNIERSETQHKILYNGGSKGIDAYFDEDDIDAKGDAFLIKERMVYVACLPKNEKINDKSVKNVVANLSEYAPKIKDLVETIQNNPGKHVVYCTFVESGLRVIEAVLRSKGWVSYNDVLTKPSLAKTKKGLVFAVWDGTTDDKSKSLIKATVNDPVTNLEGDKIRVILGSPSIKEGVSFKHVQHMHIVDPLWNTSAKGQVEGRAVRFCSHSDIPEDHPVLDRKVLVHLYRICADIEYADENNETADEKIYNIVLPKKKLRIEAGEAALKKVAFDYYLFRKLYRDSSEPLSPMMPRSADKNALSPLNIRDLDVHKAKKGKGVATSCPAQRRPDPDTNKCPRANMIVKKNKKGEPCCYVAKRDNVKKKLTCPKARRPSKGKNGELLCPEGKQLRNNKHGEPCCYSQ